VALAALAVAGGASPDAAGHSSHAAHRAGHDAGSAGSAILAFALMAVAMMLPLARSPARWLAFRSLRSHRQAAIAVFAASCMAVWVAAGAVLVVVLGPVRGSLPAVAAALAVAAAWQVAPARRRLLRRCGTATAPAIRGRRAVADWSRGGARAGARCVGTCWAVMAPMAIVHHPALMALAALVVFGERRAGPNPERRGGRPFEARVLAAAAAAVLVLAAAPV
jgi:predicted metal-binding membrane protein